MLAAGLAACGRGGDDAPPTVAFLRALPGTGSTEPQILRELRQSGYEVGRNLRLLGGDSDVVHPEPDDARATVEGWVQEGVDVIVALSSAGALVAEEAAPGVPIVFLSNDPVATGLVDDESAPEGMTGVTFRVPADRTLDLAARVVPGLATVGLAYPPDDPAALANRDAVADAAAELGLELVAVPFDGPAAVADAVERIEADGAQVLMLSTSPTALRALAETGEAAAAHGLPVVSNTDLARFAVIALSPDTEEIGRQLGRQIARLLAGSQTEAIPVEDPRRFLLQVNAGRATELGLTVPADLVREANEVIG